MNPESLHVAQTNSAQEHHGQLLGVELSLFRWVIGVLFCGLALFAALAAKRGAGLTTAFWVVLVPAAVFALLLVWLFQKKHPSHPRDLAESVLTGGDVAPSPTDFKRSSWLDLLTDGCFVNGLIVFNGLGPGGWVAKGFSLEVPDLQHASAQERNRFHDQVRRLLRFVPANFRLQVLWWVDSDYKETLVRQHQKTAKTDNADSKRENNFAFLHFLEQMKRGELRRQRVAIFLSREVEKAKGAPWRRREAENYYGERLAALQSEFAELGRNLQSLFADVTGGATPMTDADHFRLFLNALNPSIAKCYGYDPLPGFDPSRSILDNCFHSQLRGRGSRGFWLDEYEHGVLVLKRWPAQVYPTIIYRLTLLPFNDYTISVQVRPLPSASLIASTQKELDRLNTLLAAKPDARQQVTREKLERRIEHLTRGDQVPLGTELVIMVRARNAEQLSERMQAIKSALHGLGGAEYAEGSPAFSKNCFYKSLPGCSWIKHRGFELFGEDDVVAAMLPLSSSFGGRLDEAEVICPGSNENLVGISTCSGQDADTMPNNVFVIGGPGMGKSRLILSLTKKLAALYEYYFVIEEGLSHAELTRSFGVEPIIWRLDGRQSLNCLDTLGLPWSASHQASAAGLVARMAGLPADEDKARHRLAFIGKKIDELRCEVADECLNRMSEPQRRDFVRQAMTIQGLAAQKNLSLLDAFIEWRRNQPAQAHLPGMAKCDTSDSALWEFESRHADTLRDLIYTTFAPDQHLRLSALKDSLMVNAIGPEAELCRQIATLLEPYCGDGIYGAIFDRPTNVSLTGRIVHFELGQIPESAGELKGLIAFLIVNQIRQHLITLPKHQRKMLILEELSRCLTIPGAEKLVRELYEQMRKTNTLVIAILQIFSRLSDPALRAAIIGNSMNYIIFNPGDRTDLALLAKEIGLSSVAQETILHYVRPSQLAGRKYSEFTYFYVDPNRPVCGTVRHFEFAAPPKGKSSPTQTEPSIEL